MKKMIIDYKPSDKNEEEEKPSYIDIWYDHYTKNWVVQVMNKRGYQVGNSTYVYRKIEAKNTGLYLSKQYGIEIKITNRNQ